jgi:hypothetical protein
LIPFSLFHLFSLALFFYFLICFSSSMLSFSLLSFFPIFFSISVSFLSHFRFYFLSPL